MKKKPRLTIDDRINLQAAIAKGSSLNEVCKLLKKNRTTIYRELTNYYTLKASRKSCAHCSKADFCKENGVVMERHIGSCPDFQGIRCYKLKKFPYVCNTCNIKISCYNDKRYYDCSKAEAMSLQNRISTRRRKMISSENISEINKIVSPLIKDKGQSIHHIYVTNPKLWGICSERTVRRLIYDRYLDAKAHDLQRYVRFKHENKYAIVRESKISNVERMYKRTFTDFVAFVKRNPDMSVVQFDSVEGKRDDIQAILTLTFPKERFQFGRLIRKGSPHSVQSIMRNLFNIIGYEKARKIFQVNLADNGIEFSHFHKLEQFDVRVYFTNPYRSTDKAACERNHEFIRYIIPKGKTLNNLSQDDVNLMFSHINSYVRKSNQNKTPYELIVERFGPDFIQAIGIKKIEPNDVILKPRLLKK